MTKTAAAVTITEHETREVETANATGKTPVVFVHGLWLLPSSSGTTEILEITNRGHSLTIDSGWREVADAALTFIRRFVSP